MNMVQKFYDDNTEHEWDRLDNRRMEFGVTMLAFEEHLPAPPLKILDIGGGPGRYAISLVEKGYDVTLLDLSKNCLELAKEKAHQAGVKLNGYIHGNAMDLSEIERESYDAVLLMGPLYHLLMLEERQKAVKEAAAVLKPGGYIAVSFITRFARFNYSSGYEPDWIAKYPDRCETLLETGVLNNEGYSFTDSYCAHPCEVQQLMQTADLTTVELIGCEVLFHMNKIKIDELEPDLWKKWVKMNYRLGKDPSLHGAAVHLLYVGRKAEK